MATTGLTKVPSYAGPSETMTRLEAAINAAGMTVFARIDHGAAAVAVHLPLGPTELVAVPIVAAMTSALQRIVAQATGSAIP